MSEYLYRQELDAIADERGPSPFKIVDPLVLAPVIAITDAPSFRRYALTEKGRLAASLPDDAA